MYIDGFGFSGYRSFDDNEQLIAPMSKINILIGQNNCGKSNVINFLKEYYGHFLKAARGFVKSNSYKNSSDWHVNSLKKSVKFSVAVKLGGVSYNKNRELIDNDNFYNEIFELMSSSDNKIQWFHYDFDGSGKHLSNAVEFIYDNMKYPRDEWYRIWNRITNQTSGDIKQHWIPEVLRRISPVIEDVKNIELIPAVRKIGDPESVFDGYSGLGIIDKLAELQNPTLDNQNDWLCSS